MKFVSLIVGACVFATANAHFGIFVQDINGRDGDRNVSLSYCVPFEANVSNIIEWYSYGDPEPRSFNALTEFADNMVNRATVLSAATLGGHDPDTESSFGFVFGSTNDASSAGSAEFRCFSNQWIGLRDDPLRVMDDPEGPDGDSVSFDHMSGFADFSFRWEAGETDGFLVYEINEHFECTVTSSTGLTEPIGLLEDEGFGDDGVGQWKTTEVMFAEGTRVEVRQSCTLTTTPSRSTDGAAQVTFTTMDSVNSDGTASGIFWYNETTGYLTWQMTFQGFSSMVTGFELRNGDDVVLSLGSDDLYFYTPSGTVMITEADAEVLLANELTLVITTADNPDGELSGGLEFGVAEDPDDDGMNSAPRSTVGFATLAFAAGVASSML